MSTIVGLAKRLEPMEEMNEETSTTESDVEGGADEEGETTFEVVLGTITEDGLIATADIGVIDGEDVEAIDGEDDGLSATSEDEPITTLEVVVGTISGDELIAASDIRAIERENVEIIDGDDGLTSKNRLVATSEVELVTIFDVVPIGGDEEALWLILLDVEADMVVVGSTGQGIAHIC